MKNAFAVGVVVASFVVLPGCATITSSELQTLTLTTASKEGQSVAKANCVLQNDKGRWQAVSPSAVAVRRSAQDLIVTCSKEGTPDGQLRAVSRAAAGMFGNIIFGGGVGAIIDHTKGTGYNYPDDLPVKMGMSLTVDRRQSASPETESPGTAAPAEISQTNETSPGTPPASAPQAQTLQPTRTQSSSPRPWMR